MKRIFIILLLLIFIGITNSAIFAEISVSGDIDSYVKYSKDTELRITNPVTESRYGTIKNYNAKPKKSKKQRIKELLEDAPDTALFVLFLPIEIPVALFFIGTGNGKFIFPD